MRWPGNPDTRTLLLAFILFVNFAVTLICPLQRWLDREQDCTPTGRSTLPYRWQNGNNTPKGLNAYVTNSNSGAIQLVPQTLLPYCEPLEHTTAKDNVQCERLWNSTERDRIR